jgi:hypothetical protein
MPTSETLEALNRDIKLFLESGYTSNIFGILPTSLLS